MTQEAGAWKAAAYPDKGRAASMSDSIGTPTGQHVSPGVSCLAVEIGHSDWCSHIRLRKTTSTARIGITQVQHIPM